MFEQFMDKKILNFLTKMICIRSSSMLKNMIVQEGENLKQNPNLQNIQNQGLKDTPMISRPKVVNTKKLVISFLIAFLLMVVIIFGVFLLYQSQKPKKVSKIISFEDCISLGGIVIEEFEELNNSRICRLKDGRELGVVTIPEATKLPETPSPTGAEVTSSRQSITIQYLPKGDWETYTDNIAKFSIQYDTRPKPPSTSYLALGKHKEGEEVTILSCLVPQGGPQAGKEVCQDVLNITIHNFDNSDLANWFRRNFSYYPSCRYYYTDITLAGKKGLVSTNNCSSWGGTFILIPNQGKVVVTFEKSFSREEESGEIILSDWLKEILSTFRFNS